MRHYQEKQINEKKKSVQNHRTAQIPNYYNVAY